MTVTLVLYYRNDMERLINTSLKTQQLIFLHSMMFHQYLMQSIKMLINFHTQRHVVIIIRRAPRQVVLLACHLQIYMTMKQKNYNRM